MTVSSIPGGFHSITPYLIVDDAAAAIDFYKTALDAIETMRLPGPDNSVMHAEIKIGDSIVMLADECLERNIRSPKSIGDSPVGLMVYVDDVDAKFQQALSAGGKETKPLEDQFYGDQSGTFKDPFGHQWTMATHIEDVSNDEIQRRLKEMMS